MSQVSNSPSFINRAGERSWPFDDDTTSACSIKEKEMLDIERRLAAVTGGGLQWWLTFLWMIVACLNVQEDGWAPGWVAEL